MAYYAIVKSPTKFTTDELEQNVSALFAWRDYIQQLLKRPVHLQLIRRRPRGLIVRLTDREAFQCLVGSNSSRQVFRAQLPTLKNTQTELHIMELNSWRHRQLQLIQQATSAVVKDTQLSDQRRKELLLELDLERQFVESRTSIPYLYYPKTYNSQTRQIVPRSELVGVNGELYVITSTRDDLMTIAIDRFPNRYLEYVNEPELQFRSHSDRLTYYRNVIPWQAREYIDEFIDELDLHPERSFLSLTGLSDNASVDAVNVDADDVDALYIEKLSSYWTEERVTQLLKFFDPVGYRDIKLKWWLTYDNGTDTNGAYHLNLTLMFPPGRRQASVFKHLFPRLDFEVPPLDGDYDLQQHIRSDAYGNTGDDTDVVRKYNPKWFKRSVSQYDVFKRLVVLGLPTERLEDGVRYSDLHRLLDRIQLTKRAK